MSGHGTITLPFGNGEYEFNVARHKQLFELQDRCGLLANGADGERILIPCGPFELFERLRGHRWREADVREPIRLGLLGAGMDQVQVRKLMTEFVDDQPLGQWAPVAARIVHAAIYGVQGDDVGKKKTEEEDGGEAIRIYFLRSAQYGRGAAIGLGPRAVDDMTPWELNACIQGWNDVHGAEQKPEPMSDARFERLKAEAA